MTEQYPLPSHVASVWLDGPIMHVAMGPSEGRTRGHQVAFRVTDEKGLWHLYALLKERELARSSPMIGLEGSPTQALTVHQLKHSVFADERCPFCRKLALRGTGEGEAPKKLKPLYPQRRFVADGTVEVRLVPSGVSGLKRRARQIKVLSTQKSARELGL